MPAETINLSPQDIARNLQGLLSGGQERHLRSARIVTGLRIAGFILAMLAIGVFFVIGLYPLILVCLYWLWLLRHAGRDLRAIQQDLATGTVQTRTAPVHTELSFSPGIIRLANYRLVAGDSRFAIDQQMAVQFRAHEAYTLFIAPRSQILLGAMRAAAETAPAISPPPAIVEQFNPRQMEILALLGEGLSNKEIAARLFLSVNTIKMYVSQIYRILGVHRRTEAVAKARQLGLLP
jgi:DNA-binding CsgD family transcriptional regulator